MRTSPGRRFIHSLIIFLRYPFLWLFFAVFRRKVQLRFFKPDAVYAFEGIPVCLRWYVRNACSVWISDIGYVSGSRGMHIIAATQDKRSDHLSWIKQKNGTVESGLYRFTLVAKGVGGTVQASFGIRIVPVRPARPSAQLSPVNSRADVSRVMQVRLLGCDGSNLMRPATGLVEECNNPLLTELERIRMTDTIQELKKTN
jgi:hypothetical protein